MLVCCGFFGDRYFEIVPCSVSLDLVFKLFRSHPGLHRRPVVQDFKNRCFRPRPLILTPDVSLPIENDDEKDGGKRSSKVQDGDILGSPDRSINLKTNLSVPNDLDAGLSVRVWSRVKLRLRFGRRSWSYGFLR